MSSIDKIRVFDDKQVRMEWNEEEQDWYLSIIDVIAILTDQPTQRSATDQLFGGSFSESYFLSTHFVLC